jgi:hypothetical protein
MPPTYNNSEDTESANATHRDDELYSDTIEVQTPHAHPSPPEDQIINLDGTAESTPLSEGPPSDVFPHDDPIDFATSYHPEKSPSRSVHSHEQPEQVSESSNRQSPAIEPATQEPAHFVPDPPTAASTAPAHSQAPQTAPAGPPGYFSTLKMTISMPKPASPQDASLRRVKQYTLPNGAVVSGKGLGRGRPGIKRGPRHPKADEDGRSVSTPSSMSASAFGTSTSNTAASNKRRRTESDAHKFGSATPDSESMFSGSRDSSPEYNPTGETRSGRKTNKPVVSQTPVAESASPASKRPKLESRNTAPTASPVVKTHPKIKRRMYRGREQLALCEHCQRGHGPIGNNIVFCDACNRCWHQRCHEPQVPQSVITDTKADWYCANCEKILHGKKGKKGKATASSVPATTQAAQFVGPLVGGAALSPAHKLAFLQSRTKEQLISLILSGSDLAPALPLFQAPAPQLPQAQFKSDYTTPVTSIPFHTAAAAAEAEDEGYDSYFDEHAALYPKPGNGVKLPPESADVHMLLEHPQSRTFSHWIRGMPTREFSGNADIVFKR